MTVPSQVAGQGERAQEAGPSASEDMALPAVERSYPALRMQAGMLFESERDPDRPTYHVVSESLLSMPGLSRQQLEFALRAVTAAQPGLWTGFDLAGAGGPLQLVRALPRPPLRYTDLSALTAGEADERLAGIRQSEREQTFGWDDFPLWRLACVALPGGTTRLFLSHHHAVLDGWSVAVFFAELLAALEGGVVASPADVCELAAEAEAEALASAESAAHWSGIARQWGGFPVRSRARQGGEPPLWMVARPIDRSLREGIRRACGAWRCSAQQLFLAAHLRALELATSPGGSPPGTVAVVNARPETLDAHLALGIFLNAVPVLPPASGAAWRDRVSHVAAAQLAMLDHRHFPFAGMRSEFGLPGPTTWFTYTDFAGISTGGVLDTVIEYSVTEIPLTVAVVDDGLMLDGSSAHFTSAEVSGLADMHVASLREAVGQALGAGGDPGGALATALRA